MASDTTVRELTAAEAHALFKARSPVAVHMTGPAFGKRGRRGDAGLAVHNARLFTTLRQGRVFLLADGTVRGELGGGTAFVFTLAPAPA